MIDSFITADRLSSQAGSGPIAGYSLSPIVFLANVTYEGQVGIYVTDLIATLRIKRFYGLGGVQPVGVAFRVDFISSNSSNHATAILLKSNLTVRGTSQQSLSTTNSTILLIISSARSAVFPDQTMYRIWTIC
ncbi:hypothetical protein PGTUg99_000084 [Puccinia graminis f. sp. tritici]|uniref:Uncharacterized protein n=1 Tax=Puccinia graminis f. sp. tritici TaxID=56615 RepID=A0A5B0PWG2_PUCGR|nr:hypothetical protein PGTUg99_000084 [Puccinia graminis f. sp. tritici]